MQKYEKGISGSVQAKNGKLYFVASIKDPITQQRKVKWKTLGLPEGTPKAVVDKAKRDAQAKFEAEEKARIAGSNIGAIIGAGILIAEALTDRDEPEQGDEPTMTM